MKVLTPKGAPLDKNSRHGSRNIIGQTTVEISAYSVTSRNAEVTSSAPFIEVSMVKKAKRRGRPPGSKNKTSMGNSVPTMDIAQLRAHIDSLQGVLAKKVSEQRAYFEGQLSQLGGYVAKRTSAAVKIVTPGKGKRAKAKPKYQSKKNKSVKWSGRGMTPVWMRKESRAPS